MIKRQSLYGLVLSGGKSRRMGRDKSLLKYHGKPQVRHAYELLSRFCGKVFVSNRREQSSTPALAGLPQIHDAAKFKDIGPLGGILTAMGRFPRRGWLVLACDLPHVDRTVLRKMIAKRDRLKFATAYRSSHDGLPEPLCAIYEPSYRKRLQLFLSRGVQCPRKIMINSKVRLLRQSNRKSLDNVNDRREYRIVLKELKAHGPKTN